MKIVIGDSRNLVKRLKPSSIQCCVTSPPYFGLRDYGHPDQMGLEETPKEFIDNLVSLFRDLKQALADNGVLWVNLGDSYARNPKKGQHKPGDSGKQAYVYDTGGGRAANSGNSGLPDKSLIGIPWRFAFAMVDDGWILRQDIIWHKPNPMPESVRDRCTKAHEYIFMFTKSPKYFFNHDAMKEPANYPVGSRTGKKKGSFQSKYANTDAARPGDESFRFISDTRNKRSVWTVPTKPFRGSHFATFPPDLIEPCILSSSRPGDVVFDPFGGAGTTGLVADRFSRDFLLFEANPEYAEMAKSRIMEDRNARR